MIRIAIVEDEEEYIQQLTDYLQEYQKNSKEEIAVTVYRDGDEITSKYKSQFDIILMDIQMKFINGMTAAQEIRNVDSSVVIIFNKLKKQDRHYVVVPIKGGVVRLDTADIYYIEVQGHNLIYHASAGEYISPGTISAAEKTLCSYGFSRGNKSYLINLAHVDGIQDKCAQVKGESLPLGRPRQSAFLQDLTKYWGEH